MRFDSNVHGFLCGVFGLALAAAGCSSAVIERNDGGGGTGGSGTGGHVGTGGGAGSPAGGSGGSGTGGGAGGTGGVVGGTGGHGGAGAGGTGGATGGHTGTGGSTGGAGGHGGLGGGTGGAPATGGSPGTGGAPATGGSPGTGGRPDAGTDAGLPVTPTTAGQIVISELMHDTVVAPDDGGEWFEVYNPSTSVTYDLFDCQIHDTANSDTIAAHLLVPPHAFRTLAIFAIGGGFVPDYTYSGIKFDNDNADLVSITCGSTLIDKFSYTKSQAQSGKGHSFSVDPAHYNAVDNDNPAFYCAGSTIYNMGDGDADYGSPGVTNPPCP